MASLGQSLKEEREARSISLEEIASATKIVPRYLEALEADRLDLMPGGFFVRGIIRAYAKAVGLSPEEVLARYKEAGLLGPSEHERSAPSKPAAAPPILPHAEPAHSVAPPSPETAVRAAEAPAEPEPPGPSLLFEEAAKPKRSPEARHRILAWVWRGVAGLLIVGTGLVLWAPWRRHAAAPRTETVVARSELPSSRKDAAPVAAPATEPAAPGAGQVEPSTVEPAATRPEAGVAAPPAQEIWKGITIEIVFQAETWIQVYTDGTLQVGGLFPAGATARAQASEKLLIHTGNAGGFTFTLNGRPAKPLGRSGQVLTDIKITPENLKDFLEDPSAGRPAGDGRPA